MPNNVLVQQNTSLEVFENKYDVRLSNLPILDKQQRIHMAADVSYCYMHSIEFFNGTSSDLGYFLQQTGLSVTEIFDKIENGELAVGESADIYENVKQKFDYWYANEANELEKSVLFYKFINGLEYQLKEYSKTLFEYLSEINFNIDKRLKFDTVKQNLIKYCEDNTKESSDDWLIFEDSSDNHITVDRISNMINFLNILEDKYTLYKSNVKYTLDEVMILMAHQKVNNFNIGFFNTTDTAPIQNTKEIEYIEPKKEKRSIRRMLNKSIKTITGFIPKEDIQCFIGGGEFEVSGSLFNYKISKKNNYKLLQSPDELNSAHIPYMLDLYDKDNIYLANLCITFNGCPILDQILSVYLMISSNQEEDMLDNCNFYKKSQLFNENKNIQKIMEMRNTGSSAFEEMTISTLRNNVDALPVLNKVRREEIKFENYFKSNILGSIFDREAVDFIFNTEVTWDEMCDYYSISRNGNSTSDFGDGGVFSDSRMDNVLGLAV